MIFGELGDAALLRTLEARLQPGIDFLLSPSTASLGDGRYDLPGGGYALVQTYEPGRPEEKRFEAHRRHIDIQALLSGREIIEHAFARALTVAAPYDGEKDVMFFDTPAAASPLLLRSGLFAVFYPADAHRPGLRAPGGAGEGPVRKVVVKATVGAPP
ncbi:MAG: YhcH/YjgK/YiaL family protein [Planctomycetes bacterium]|nr:YhcH/YjgK/YiaL family protein [Planctomycetota bacterium]